MGDPVEQDFDSEDARVFRRHMHEFERMGYDERTALRLAEAGVDWREVGRLLAAGCDQQTALRILL